MVPYLVLKGVIGVGGGVVKAKVKTFEGAKVLVLVPENESEEELLEAIWNSGCRPVAKDGSEVWLAEKESEKEKRDKVDEIVDFLGCRECRRWENSSFLCMTACLLYRICRRLSEL